MLRKFSTLPNISLSYSYQAGNGLDGLSTCAPFGGYKYAATEVAESTSAGSEEDDEEMTDCSGVTSDTESINETSLEEEARKSSGKASNLKREEEVHLEYYEGSLLQDPGEQSPDSERQDATTGLCDLSEWEVNGGLHATQAAFEGTYLLDASLDAITEWSAPIVWKMFLRQAQ
jgi:hypothetical protein